MISQVLTFFAALSHRLVAALFHRGRVRIAIRLDHSGVGAHLIWTITNGRSEPVTMRQLVFRGAHGSSATVALDPPRTITPQGQLILPIDVDWNLLGAHAIAVVDGAGHSHEAPRHQLASVQDRLREAIDRRRATPSSARDFLSGAADLAFGVVLLGLGFFMLMWMIATG